MILPAAIKPELPIAKSIRAAESAVNSWYDTQNSRHENLTQLVQKAFGQGL
jgi:hypothetical protein